MLKDYLEQLERSRHLKEFGVEPRSHTCRLVTQRKGVLTVFPVENCWDEQPSEKRLKYTRESICFNDDDLDGMT